MKNDERVRWRVPVSVWKLHTVCVEAGVECEVFFFLHTKTERLLFTPLKASFKDAMQPLEVQRAGAHS